MKLMLYYIKLEEIKGKKIEENEIKLN